jgi:diacylglycerol kinase (ATP)
VTAAGLVINPISGAGADRHAAEHRAALARQVAERAGVPIEVVVTEHAGHARALARGFKDKGMRLIVAWGGDGTVNEIASELVGTDIAVGIIPSGSGNGLATEFGFSRDPKRALQDALLEARDLPIDVGSINGRIFTNIAGIGFDGHVAHQFQLLAQGRRGGRPYLTIAMKSAWRYRPKRYTVEISGEVIEVRALLMAFANGRQYGNGAVIAPKSSAIDGLLDLVVVDDRAVWRNFLRVHHLFRRTADQAPGVLTRQLTSARVTSDDPLEIHVDGEIVDRANEAAISIRPSALTLRVPQRGDFRG